MGLAGSRIREHLQANLAGQVMGLGDKASSHAQLPLEALRGHHEAFIVQNSA
jgi:hypothetical protein